MSYCYAVSLQARHPSADPKEIAANIPFSLVRSWMVGEPRSTPKGNPLTGVYRETYCAFAIARRNDGQLARCLRGALDKLDGSNVYLSRFTSTDGSLNFYVTWTPGTRGELFDVRLLNDMARISVALGIEPVARISGLEPAPKFSDTD